MTATFPTPETSGGWTATTPDAGSPGPITRNAPRGRVVRGGRGRLVIGRNVVEKIARQAASEIATAGGRTGGVLGIGSHTDMAALPEADVELSGRTASIDLVVSVAYPAPLRQTTERVRQHVMDRVAELAGIEVTRVDITIAALHSSTSGPEALR